MVLTLRIRRIFVYFATRKSAKNYCTEKPQLSDSTVTAFVCSLRPLWRSYWQSGRTKRQTLHKSQASTGGGGGKSNVQARNELMAGHEKLLQEYSPHRRQDFHHLSLWLCPTVSATTRISPRSFFVGDSLRGHYTKL